MADCKLLPFNFNVEEMKAEIKVFCLNNFGYYNVIPLRAPGHIVDTSLSFSPPAKDYADGSWTDWLNTKDLLKSPYLLNLHLN
jgi:hypothetical protein